MTYALLLESSATSMPTSDSVTVIAVVGRSRQGEPLEIERRVAGAAAAEVRLE